MPKRRTLLVTGGAGYIGSHAVRMAHGFGFDPVVVDDLSQGRRAAVGRAPLVRANLADAARLRAAFRRYKPCAVMHFAAHCLVGESVTDPRKYYRDNLVSALTLWDEMLRAGVKCFVLSSTCATYGNPVRVPMDEAHPQEPINPYGDSKLMLERMLAWYDRAYGLKSVILRYFNAAGADPSGDIGETHDPETHLIPLVLDAAGGRREFITVFGEDYPTPDGTCVRDYIHVTDLVEAHFKALARLEARGESEAFNLGTGKGYSVREVIAAAERATGRKVPVKAGPRRPGDPPELVADSRKAREILGWEPRHSDLETILRTAWNFHRKYYGKAFTTEARRARKKETPKGK